VGRIPVLQQTDKKLLKKINQHIKDI